LRKNYRFLEHLDDSVVAALSFRDIASMAGKNEKNSKILSERLASNYDSVSSFTVAVEAGEDDCTGRAHPARFLRGYVGNSQEEWLQARQVQQRTGLPPIANYETVTVGLSGMISSRVWYEVHNPSSKVLSIRLLSNAAMKSAWTEKEKAGESHEFASLQEFRMAVVALEACVHKVMPWNFSVTTIAVFLHSINFGESELGTRADSLSVLADFVDEILRHNSQAWDEGRHFLSNIEVAAKWSAMIMRRNAAARSDPKKSDSQKRGAGAPGGKSEYPKGVCRNFNNGRCSHPGDKHISTWDANLVLNHKCDQWVEAKKRYCLENHARKDHK